MVAIFLWAMGGCHVSQPAGIFTSIVTVVEEDDETIEIWLPKIDIPIFVVGPEKDMCGLPVDKPLKSTETVPIFKSSVWFPVLHWQKICCTGDMHSV